MRTLARVSGSRRPTRPPQTNTEDASRMGMALVIPTSEPKIRLPSTAASLHMALQKPKPVPLEAKRDTGSDLDDVRMFIYSRPINVNAAFTVPPVCWVELCGHYIQGVPGRDAEAIVETQHEDHHGLTGAKPKEEAADARQHHGASCRTQHETFLTSQTLN